MYINFNEPLPQAIEVGGSFFRIHTDFKFFIRFAELQKTKNVKIDNFDFMYIDEPPADKMAGLRALCEFANPPRELPRRTDEESGEIVLDYTTDAPYIYAAFLEQYHIDLLDTRLHWHKFLALLHALHDTELNNIIGCRLWKPSGRNDDYEKRQAKKYEAWRLPQPEEEEPDDALTDFLRLIK